ncbi:uncharacterized protein LOC129945204 [Eupeodes corollae]|uniref:uncharacterized protein LOC129945204 n=1 Tax=Eupeodes corollae TaxID=290404 RepID=UPI002490E8E4|nr:uncharacterized protein LOC129945204 [Eupeodes corollae]
MNENGQRNFFVEIYSCKSTIRDVKAGVAQGEAHISRLYVYYQKWGIRINTSKSELVSFRRPVTNNSRCRSAAVARNLVLTFPDGSRIRAKKNAKYLEIHFNDLLCFNPHSKAVITKANIALYRVHPLLKKKTGLSKPTKLLIYKQLLRPVITYSFPIWFTISKNAMEKFKVFEKKILRICTNLQFDRKRPKHYSNRRVYEEAEIKPLDQFLAQAASKIITKVASHPNQLMRRMTN